MLGAALALGCLLVFPSAEIWRSDTAEPDVVNGVGNVLTSAVVGAFGLITLFLNLRVGAGLPDLRRGRLP